MLFIMEVNRTKMIYKILPSFVYQIEMGYKHHKDLKDNKKMLGVWGLGYIGYSSIAYFAKEGIRCLGTDIDETKVESVNLGKTQLPNVDQWLGFDTAPLAKAGMMQATTNWKELISNDVNTHLVCVPTEKHDKPFDDALIDVTNKLTRFKSIETDYPPLIIVESTLTPDRVDNLVFPMFEEEGFDVGSDILIGVAPRRDWFVSPDKTLRTLPRVVGGSTPQTTDLMSSVLGTVCDNVLRATNHKHAAIVKSVENAYRCVGIQLANELSLAYPDINVTEVMKLASTKWNIEAYHPSIGIGGYCIPLAPKYLKEGAESPEKLNIFESTIKSFERQPSLVAESLIEKNFQKIGVLGIAYKGDLKVHVLSPSIEIVKKIKKHGIQVKVHDPYYSEEEIEDILGVDTFSYPEEMSEFEALVIGADHALYKGTPTTEILENLESCKLIIDNMGVWNNIPFEEKGIEYHEAGDRYWLGGNTSGRNHG